MTPHQAKIYGQFSKIVNIQGIVSPTGVPIPVDITGPLAKLRLEYVRELLVDEIAASVLIPQPQLATLGGDEDHRLYVTQAICNAFDVESLSQISEQKWNDWLLKQRELQAEEKASTPTAPGQLTEESQAILDRLCVNYPGGLLVANMQTLAESVVIGDIVKYEGDDAIYGCSVPNKKGTLKLSGKAISAYLERGIKVIPKGTVALIDRTGPGIKLSKLFYASAQQDCLIMAAAARRCLEAAHEAFEQRRFIPKEVSDTGRILCEFLPLQERAAAENFWADRERRTDSSQDEMAGLVQVCVKLGLRRPQILSRQETREESYRFDMILRGKVESVSKDASSDFKAVCLSQSPFCVTQDVVNRYRQLGMDESMIGQTMTLVYAVPKAGFSFDITERVQEIREAANNAVMRVRQLDMNTLNGAQEEESRRYVAAANEIPEQVEDGPSAGM